MSWRDIMKDADATLGLKQHTVTLDLAEKIASAMKARRIRATDLAGKLGKSRAWISKLLHGGRNTTLFTAVEVADALGYDLTIDLVPRVTMAQPTNLQREASSVSLQGGDPQQLAKVLAFTKPGNIPMTRLAPMRGSNNG